MYLAIITAAGESRRFPGNKLLYRLGTEPVIVKTIESAFSSRVDKIMVIVGFMKEKIINEIKNYFSTEIGRRILIVENKNFAEGMSSSIKVGVSAALELLKDLKALLITPGDAAWIPSIVYDLLIDKFEMFNWRIIVPTYNNRRGHPILFSASLVQEILSISEESRGLKGLVEKYRYEVREIELPYPSILLDLDTINDLNRVKEFSFQ
ncbi:nucleotidyltransferase family protein [Thermogladius sp. 4427co]|uniref:nucleotidyltransferase family protein n=1 Tax=Thermogladius sp. 4427co TaxID=3450718 RepID=UPI003F793512